MPNRHLPVLCQLVCLGESVLYHLYMLYLSTASDIKTIVVPCIATGFVSDLSVSEMLSRLVANRSQQACTRLPYALLWVWLDLLPSITGNQRSLAAIQEDRLNMPWRPLP